VCVHLQLHGANASGPSRHPAGFQISSSAEEGPGRRTGRHLSLGVRCYAFRGCTGQEEKSPPQAQVLAGPTLNLLSSIQCNPVLRGTAGSGGAAISSADIQGCVEGVQSVLATCSSRGLDSPGAQAVDAFLRLLPAPLNSAPDSKSWQPAAAQCLRSIAALDSGPASLAARHSAASCGLFEGVPPESTDAPSVLATVLAREGEAGGGQPGVLDSDALRARWEELWAGAGQKGALEEHPQWLQALSELSHEPHRVREARCLIQGALQAYQDAAEAEAKAEETQPPPGPADPARAEAVPSQHVQTQLPAQWRDKRSSLEQIFGVNGTGAAAAGQGRVDRSASWGAPPSAREDRAGGGGRERAGTVAG